MLSDYLFVICWLFYRLSYFDLSLQITTLVSFGHCIVCPTLIYAFWLPLCYMLAILSSVRLQFMPSDYTFGIFWPLYRLSYFDLWLPITNLVSVGHCIVCPTSIYAFWLPIWYLLAIVSSVLLWFMPSDYHIGIFWPLYRLSYFDVCLLITTLVPCGIVSSVLLWFMPSDYHIGILWPLYRLSYFNVCLLITTLVSFGQCVVCPTLIYASWLLFGIFWPLYRLSYFDLYLLITPLVSFVLCIVCPTLICAFWLPFWYLLIGHCIVCLTSMYAFWLPIWYFLAIVSSVLLRFMPSDYPFVICWPLYRLSYLNLCLLITPLLYLGHCIVCPTSINAFWLPL